MPKRPCLRCGELTSSGSFCPRHRPRGKAWQGGSTRAWRALRAQVIERDGCCVVCGSTEGLEAHHRRPRSEGGSDTLGNLETRCSRCHGRAHGAEGP